MIFKRRRPKPKPLVSVADYTGQPVVTIAGTQLGPEYSTAEAKRIVADWMEFFSSGPSPITDLTFCTRTPKRLFESLSTQTQLEWLSVKWGDYDDLAPLSELSELKFLELRGATSVVSVAPISHLHNLESLSIEGFKVIHDLNLVTSLVNLTDLELGGAWMSSRNAHIGSIEFLRLMPQLQRLHLHTVIVDSKDYSPLLDLPNLKSVRVMEVRGMRPSPDELKQTLPWSS